MSICSECKLDKMATEFYNRHIKCKDCTKARSADYKNHHRAATHAATKSYDAKKRAELLELRRIRGGCVYVVGMVEMDGYVKVGWSTALEERRLIELQTGNPFKMYVIGQMPGTDVDEEIAHEELKASRWRGEWFRRTPEVESFIARVVASAPVKVT